MRKLILFVLLLWSGSMSAQTLQETVYLKNGSVIKGEIIEQIPNQSIKIKTKDGNIFVYKMDEVEKIAKEQASTLNYNRLYKGLEYNIDLGVLISTQSGGGNSFLGGVGIGKRFNNNFYLGGGLEINLASGGFWAVPVYINPKVYFPFEESKLDLFLDAKTGISFYDGGHSGLAELLFGIQMPVSSTVDFNIGAGYTMSFAEGTTSGAIAIKTGIGVHSSTNSAYASRHREPVPTRDKGLQLTLEGGPSMSLQDGEFADILGDIVISYKLNSNISLGCGLGYNLFEDGLLIFQEDDYYSEYINNTIDFFIRGMYKFNNSKLTPFALVDLGIKRFSFDYIDVHVNHIELDHGYLEDLNQTKLFISPALGLSLRTTNNSYIDLCVGYDIVNGISLSDETKKVHANQLYLKLGFTHTFKWLSK